MKFGAQHGQLRKSCFCWHSDSNALPKIVSHDFRQYKNNTTGRFGERHLLGLVERTITVKSSKITTRDAKNTALKSAWCYTSKNRFQMVMTNR